MTVYSAHVDTFARDNLPPREQWPDLIFTIPEVQYPDRLNCIVELLDTKVHRDMAITLRFSAPMAS